MFCMFLHLATIAALPFYYFVDKKTIPVQKFKHIFIVTAKTMQQTSLKITFQVIGR